LDSAMGLAVQSTLAAGNATPRWIQDLIRARHERDERVIRTEGRVLNAGRRVATAEARITDAKDRLLAHATTTCLVFKFQIGEWLTLNWRVGKATLLRWRQERQSLRSRGARLLSAARPCAPRADAIMERQRR